ncbi:MAG TPA: choice-of-anchor V domain-containing protein [Polyangia bacterium]
MSHVPPRSTRLAFLIAATASALLFERVAAARAGGIVSSDCTGCHGSASQSMATISASPAMFNPGDTVTLTLTIQWSSIKVGGAYITSNGVGTLRPISGEGLAMSSGGLTHSSPKAAAGGQVTFKFSWQAPTTPGGVEIDAFVLAGNGNNAPSGDAPGFGVFLAAFGCAAQEFYRDWDADGYGARANGLLLGCPGPPPKGYAINDGDCDENNENVHPGAPEICNAKDDNCNGQIDENAPAAMLWPDPDGDGYYSSATGMSVMGCAGLKGYAALGGDCAPNDPTINPGVKEICNGKDDNCDGRIDERVRPQCGTGWCARESTSCDPADCRPGPPRAEECNLFDDDCDGQVDNDAQCDPGMQCVSGACVPGGGGGSGGSPVTGGSGGSGSGGSHASGTGGAVSVPGSGGSPGDSGASGHGSGGVGPDATGSPSSASCDVAGGEGGASFSVSLLLAIVALAGARVRRAGGVKASPSGPARGVRSSRRV